MADLARAEVRSRQIEALVEAQPECAELAQLLMEWYGEGLTRIMQLSTPEAQEQFAGDPTICGLLLVHGLHPIDAETRLCKAMQRLERRYEAQRVVVREIRDGVAVIAIEQQGGGSPPSSLPAAIEEAAMEAAPELEGVRIEGVRPAAASSLVQILPARPKPSAAPPTEVCEFCGVALQARHSHVVERENRRLICACRPCYLLFTNPAAAGGKYRVVGNRHERVAESELDWDTLETPVGMAFFIRNSNTGVVTAFYPSPAGATESALPVGADMQALQRLEPDTEALLVYRRGAESQCWIVPVDACYELVGRIRRRWRGFDGGSETHTEIESFFATLQAEATAV
jgi:hypothetical protein